jgi:hypothetical protein
MIDVLEVEMGSVFLSLYPRKSSLKDHRHLKPMNIHHDVYLATSFNLVQSPRCLGIATRSLSSHR